MEDNTSLWRSIILAEEQGKWRPEVLDLFDHKSQSTLEEVSIQTRIEWSEEQAQHFKAVLERSSASLRVMNFQPDWGEVVDYETIFPFSELAWKFPQLRDFRVFDGCYFQPSVLIRKLGVEEENQNLELEFPIILNLEFFGAGT